MTPNREWVRSLLVSDKWFSVDRTLGYIEPGTAKRKADEAGEKAAGDLIDAINNVADAIREKGE